MQLYHIVYGRPIGNSFICYIEKPSEEYDQVTCPYGREIEETTLEEITKRFAEHVEYANKHFPKTYFPYTLQIFNKEF